MNFARVVALAGPGLLLGACMPNQTLPNPSLLGGTAIRPPVADLAIGTLYYTNDETPNLAGVVGFIPLCTPNLETRGFPPPTVQRSVKELDLLTNFTSSGQLSGIETEFVKAGLDGGINRYFDYKLTNVEVVSYDAVTANQIIDTITKWDRCKGWQKLVPTKPKFQIALAYRGNLAFSRKTDVSFNTDISAKIEKLEPQLKLALKNATQYAVSGEGLFVVVDAVQVQ